MDLMEATVCWVSWRQKLGFTPTSMVTTCRWWAFICMWPLAGDQQHPGGALLQEERSREGRTEQAPAREGGRGCSCRRPTAPLSHAQRPTGEGRCTGLPFGGSEEESFPFLFQLPERPGFLGSWPLSPSSKPGQRAEPLSCRHPSAPSSPASLFH